MTKNNSAFKTVNANVIAQSIKENDKEMKKHFFLYEPTFQLDALVVLGRIVYKSGLNAISTLSSSLCCDFLYGKYGFTRSQSIIVSVILKVCQPVSLQDIGNYLGVHTDKLKGYENDLEQLVNDGVLVIVKPTCDKMKYGLNDEFKTTIYSFEPKEKGLEMNS